MNTNEENLLECGKIINTHGIKGYLKIESWCDSVDVLCALPRLFIKKRNGEFSEYEIEKASEHKKCALVKLRGIDDMNAAILLKNHIVYAEREHIPLADDAAFIADMIGLDVFRRLTGERLGKLTDVFESVASDIYVVTTDSGKEVLIPAVDEFIYEIDIKKGITVDTIPGMFEE